MQSANTNSPKISFDDDWITIEGVTFSAEPYLSEVSALLGLPDHIGFEKNASGQTVGTSYYWHAHGISALSPYLDNAEPEDETRAQRVHFIRLLIIPEMYMADLSWGGSKVHPLSLPSGNTISAFTGTVEICGLPFRLGMTIEQLARMKSGRTLSIPSDGTVWAATPTGLLCSIAVTTNGNDAAKDAKDRPIGTVDLFFEPWRQPPKVLLAIPLSADERIINSVSTKRQTDRYFDALLTNRRLIATSSTFPLPREWSLRESPEIILDSGVRMPPNIPEVLVFLVGVCMVGGIGWGAFALWPGIAATICLVVVGILGLALCAIAWEARSSRDSIAIQLRIKAAGTDDMLAYFHDQIRFSPSPIAGFIHRLKCEVSRVSSRSNGQLHRPSSNQPATSEVVQEVNIMTDKNRKRSFFSTEQNTNEHTSKGEKLLGVIAPIPCLAICGAIGVDIALFNGSHFVLLLVLAVLGGFFWLFSKLFLRFGGWWHHK